MNNKDYAKELLKEPSFIITDDCFAFGITKRGNIKDDFLKENYGTISFSFDLLEKIKKVIEGLHFDDDINRINIRFLAPKGNMPLIIIARLPERYSRDAHDDHPNDTVIILAPRMDEGSLVYPEITNKEIPNGTSVSQEKKNAL